MDIVPESLPEFNGHERVVRIDDPRAGLRGFIAIHRGNLARPAFGATRLWNYSSSREALRDALRLSRIMSYKAALAGFPYGGAKGVIISEPGASKEGRDLMLRKYAEKVENLGGLFITGADVGLDRHDLAVMRQKTRFVVGREGDPSSFTAQGIFGAIRVCLEEIYDSGDVGGRTVAVQGLGKIGFALIELLYPCGAKIFASDIDQKRVLEIRRQFPDVTAVSPAEIQFLEVDIFAPCALSGVLSLKTVPLMRCKAVVGGANNQLESPEAGDLLHERGIIYAPDYIVNAGGLICVIDEYEHGKHDVKRVTSGIRNISANMRYILQISRDLNKSLSRVADQYTEQIIYADAG